MRELIKNARQTEFSELMQKMKEAGFRPADVAKLIRRSKGSVSRILKGTQSPEESTLELFRRVVAETTGIETAAREHVRQIESKATPKEIHKQLDYLRENDPTQYETARLLIHSLHENASRKPINYGRNVAREFANATSRKIIARKAGNPARE